jgi:hypothetical protein
LHYYWNYTSRLIDKITFERKDTVVAKVIEDAKVIVEGAKVVHYEESIYSLAIALTQTERKLALIINR